MRRPSTLFRMASEVVRDGCLAINKPCGLSSAQVVRDCQVAFSPSSFFKTVIDAEVTKRRQDPNMKRRNMKKAAQLKIGHGGTLDPLATGILILGIGNATKVLPQFLHCVKTYETIVTFGASTDTYDRVGRILTKRPYDQITREKVQEAVDSFKGKQTQIPPLYSALKMNGKPLYEYAREGKPIPREIEGREVEVKEIEVLEWYEPGTHNHRWPTEVASDAERSLAEQVWRLKKQQETSGKLTPQEKEEEDQAIARHESIKKEFEERQDALIKDKPAKHSRNKKDAVMSGALGDLPQPRRNGYELKEQCETPDENTPPPWTDKGPPAVKIRMKVSSGYYVRSFCHDLGAKLESAGLMAELCRVRQSDFTVGGINCLEYDDLAKGEDVWGPKVADMLSRWNGEPESRWEGPSKPNNSVSKGNDAEGSPRQSSPKIEASREDSDDKRLHRPSQPQKRARSPSQTGSTPPRKAMNTGSSPRRSSESEKSWNGIQD